MVLRVDEALGASGGAVPLGQARHFVVVSVDDRPRECVTLRVQYICQGRRIGHSLTRSKNRSFVRFGSSLRPLGMPLWDALNVCPWCHRR